jgi:hypothetical protein
MRHRADKDFWKHYQALPQAIQTRADKQFLLLKANPQHSSLQFKKVAVVRGEDLYSARVTLDYRALAVKRSYGFLWFWIGDHKTYDFLLS